MTFIDFDIPHRMAPFDVKFSKSFNAISGIFTLAFTVADLEKSRSRSWSTQFGMHLPCHYLMAHIKYIKSFHIFMLALAAFEITLQILALKRGLNKYIWIVLLLITLTLMSRCGLPNPTRNCVGITNQMGPHNRIGSAIWRMK